MTGYELLKSALQINKTNFEKGFSTIGNIQEKIAEKGSEIVSKYSLFPEEATNVVSQWTTAFKNSMQLFQLVAEKNYTEIENYLSVRK
jgi:hypothetical protein